MNLPNKLTVFRMALVPVFIVFMNLDFPGNRVVALVVFLVAAITDTLDGYIARRYGLITDFGKFMDPLADKLLVCSALICLIDTNQISSWIVIIIIAREFIISGFRLIALDNGRVIAASVWGKVKTICQMVMIIALIIDIGYFWFYILQQVLIYMSLVLTCVSLIDYLYKNREILHGTK